MNRNYYAVDYANDDQVLTAWTSKRERDTFVEQGNKRFTKTRKEADVLCKYRYGCNANWACKEGYI